MSDDQTTLDGDDLHVSPATLARMQDVMILGGDPDAEAREALRLAGLTEAQIDARRGLETRIVVEWDRTDAG